MDLKDFFRPDLKKLLIAIVLFLVLVFLPMLPVKACNGGLLAIQKGAGIQSGYCYTMFYSVASKFLTTPLQQPVANLIALFAGLFVLSYVISCVIVFAFEKVKRR